MVPYSDCPTVNSKMQNLLPFTRVQHKNERIEVGDASTNEALADFPLANLGMRVYTVVEI